MTVSSSEESIAILKSTRSLLKKEYGVNRLGVFGSFARGQITASSDIDILVDMDRERKSLHNFMQLTRFLEHKTDGRVDLGFENSLKPIVRKRIINQIICV